MSIRFVLFDLDGTLLPMDQDVFIEHYFKGLAMKMAPHGYEPKALIKAIWAGTEAMIRNDGSVSNEEAFWRVFTGIYGPESISSEPILEDFYANEFQAVSAVCGKAPEAAQTVERVKALGMTPVLATNPIFPAIATRSRIRWAGLNEEDFSHITVYENSRHAKPNPDYYRDILEAVGARPEECLMVGNDVKEDMVAEKLGMRVFLLTDCLINKADADISRYHSGGFPELLEFLNQIAGA